MGGGPEVAITCVVEARMQNATEKWCAPREAQSRRASRNFALWAQMDIPFSCQTIEVNTMNSDPKKWNPFKFIRGSVGKSGTDRP